MVGALGRPPAWHGTLQEDGGGREGAGSQHDATRAHLEGLPIITSGVRELSKDSDNPVPAPVVAVVGKLFEHELVDPTVRHDLASVAGGHRQDHVERSQLSIVAT